MNTNPQTIAATVSLLLCAQAARDKGLTPEQAFSDVFGEDGDAMRIAVMGQIYDLLREKAKQH